MFQDLYNLYRKNGYSARIPLEDFNTESFAGILKLYPEVKNDIISFLGLPEDEYIVSTQVNYTLPDTQNCIIDLVFTGVKNICFIENKVNSSEGWEQLSRYGLALDLHHPNQVTFLVYCTKFSDPKVIETHNFKQIRWYQIAKILKTYSKNNPIVEDYCNFLKIHKMAQDNTITTDTIISMENYRKTFEIINHHVELSLPIFQNIFKFKNPIKRQDTVVTKDRIAYYSMDIFNNKTDYSELLFCINFSNVKLQTQIWVSKKHHNLIELEQLAKGKFKIEKYDIGLLIFKDRPLFDLLNDSDSDEKIKEWFTQSFYDFKQFINETPQLDWNLE